MPHSATLFRAVLLLHNIEPALAKRDVTQQLAKHLKIDETPFKRIFDLREKKSGKSFDEVSANKLFSDYVEQIENVIQVVDRLEKS